MRSTDTCFSKTWNKTKRFFIFATSVQASDDTIITHHTRMCLQWWAIVELVVHVDILKITRSAKKVCVFLWRSSITSGGRSGKGRRWNGMTAELIENVALGSFPIISHSLIEVRIERRYSRATALFNGRYYDLFVVVLEKRIDIVVWKRMERSKCIGYITYCLKRGVESVWVYPSMREEIVAVRKIDKASTYNIIPRGST